MRGHHHGERKQQRHPDFARFVHKHCLIPGSRLVTEGMPKVRI
jgi:hypothetical protein